MKRNLQEVREAPPAHVVPVTWDSGPQAARTASEEQEWGTPQESMTSKREQGPVLRGEPLDVVPEGPDRLPLTLRDASALS